MTPASDSALDFLHSTATELFTGALEACDIASAFDRRIRFEGNTLKRLLPDGSGPETNTSALGNTSLYWSRKAYDRLP